MRYEDFAVNLHSWEDDEEEEPGLELELIQSGLDIPGQSGAVQSCMVERMVTILQ